MLQIIVSIALSCGQQNKQAREMIRSFLADHRPLMVGVFKRQAKIVAYETTAPEAEAEGALKGAAELYVLLISLTGFMKVCYQSVRCHGH